jgi:hypothetical protein
MMRQLEIQYFFPLTEQVALDLDFTPCEKFAEEQRKQYTNSVISGSYLMSTGNTAVTWATVNLSDIEPSFTIDVDVAPITITSKQKPNFLKRYIYKILGMKWKAK